MPIVSKPDFGKQAIALQVSNRLKMFITKLGIDQRKFALEVGINYQNLIKILNCGTDFGISILYKIHVRYPDLNIVWLLTGEGENIQEGNSVTISNFKNSSNVGNIYDSSHNLAERLLEQNQQLILANNELIIAFAK